MMTDDFDYKSQDRLRHRTAHYIDSLLWTYKQHYKAGSVYGWLDIGADTAATILAGLLTYSLIWEAYPSRWMIGMAIAIAVISGFKTAARPQKRATQHYKAGFAYHRLFDEFRDFVVLDLADESTSINTMRERFDGLAERRLELNEEMTDVSSLWYRWLSLSYRIWGKSPYDEIKTSETAKARLTKEAKLSDVEIPPTPPCRDKEKRRE